mmetsp:Transcript_45195/g.112364  ORF Transcript_45195/g.112364 Transcript_45195/m.112364 type:complete len:354 (+) Transcript_45195:31-1092(+)
MSVQVSSDALMASYGLLVVMLTVPQFVLIHHHLHLLVMAPLLVWIGCQRALLESQKAPGESQVETVSKRDALRFPLVGSAVLFGLFIVIKLVNKEYLDILISVYFTGLGSFGLFGTVQGPITKAFKAEQLPRWSKDFHWQFWKKRENSEPISISCSGLDVVVYLLCAGIAIAYGITKKWWLNNLLGSAFAVQGIEMLSLGSYIIGCLLLTGLFFYDIFWVFGTQVMVAVAKGLDAPIKILFPKALGVKPLPLSMLGLGDIVIPGIFVAMMLRFDAKQGLVNTPYFHANMVGYVLGLALTVAVMHVFDAAQPALLYLVPACIGSSIITAVLRGELKTLLNFSEEKAEDKDSKTD